MRLWEYDVDECCVKLYDFVGYVIDSDVIE